MLLDYKYTVRCGQILTLACSLIILSFGVQPALAVGLDDDDLFGRLASDMKKSLEGAEGSVNNSLKNVDYMLHIQEVGVDQALQEALYPWNGERVLAAIGMGADVNTTDREGNPLIERAVLARDTQVIAALMLRGANIDVRRWATENTAFHQALQEALYPWNGERILAAIEMGADVNTRDREGNPLIVRAVMAGDEQVIAALVERGVNMNARRPANEYTALHQAVRAERNGEFNGNYDIVLQLLNAGADVRAINNFGNTPLALLILNFPTVRQDADNLEDVQQAFDGAMQIARLLIDRGAEVNVENYERETPLYQAALTGNTEMARLLTQYGAEPMVATLYGLMPRDVARIRGGAELRSIVAVGFFAYYFWYYNQVRQNLCNAFSTHAPM